MELRMDFVLFDSLTLMSYFLEIQRFSHLQQKQYGNDAHADK
jgi:hypothetical protein